MLRNNAKKLWLGHLLSDVMPAPPLGYQIEVLKDAPLLFLRFEEVSGTSIANLGSLGGTATLSGSINLAAPGVGRAIAMDATAATYPDTAALDILGDVTYECWVWLPSIGTGPGLISKGQGGGGNGYAWYVHSDGSMVVNKENSVVLATSAVGVVKSGGLYHLAFTRSGNIYTFYVNGVAQGTATNATAVTATTDLLRVGAGADGLGGRQSPISGIIDEAAVYATALSASRIQAHYNAGLLQRTTLAQLFGLNGASGSYRTTVMNDNPVLYLRLDEAAGDFTNYGLIGGAAQAHGTITRSVSTGLAGPGNGITPAGATTDYVSYSDWNALDIIADATYECWVKVTSLASSSGLISKGQLGGGAGYRMYVLTSGKIQVDKVNTAVLITSTGAITTGGWHHIAFTRAGNLYTIYIDGVASGTATVATVITATTDVLRIGADSDGLGNTTLPLQGSIDEAAVYDYALTAAQISAHYAARTVA